MRTQKHDPAAARSRGDGAVSAWKARQALGSPAVEAAVQRLPPRQYADDDHHHLPLREGFGLRLVTATPFHDERMIDVLRFLGRVYVADADTLFRMLYYGRYNLRTTYRDLQTLREQGLAWEARATGVYQKIVVNRRPGPPIKIFGLSRAGKQLLMNLGVEGDPRTLELLVARDVRGRVPKPSSLAHDLQVTWWCASMINGLRMVPWCTGVYVQTEFNAIKSQRADALLVARFDFTRPREQLHAIPWFSGAPRRPEELELRWALELDNSTEAVNVLVEKFCTYRDLHATGTYSQIFNGDVLLVLLVQNARRAAYLAAEFGRAWPNGWGLVSTADQQGVAADPFGALWGRYFDMISEQRVPLLSRLARDERQRVIGYEPMLTEALWQAYLARLWAGMPPASLYELTAG